MQTNREVENYIFVWELIKIRNHFVCCINPRIMATIFDIFNNREFVLLTYSTIAFTLFLFYTPLRKQFWKILKIIFTTHLINVWLIVAINFSLTLLVLQKINFLEVEHAKTAIFWLILFATPLTFTYGQKQKSDGYFKSLLVDATKLTIVIEFVVNFYSFPLLAEFIIWPFIILIAFIQGVNLGQMDNGKGDIRIQRLIENIFAVLGIALFIFLAIKIIRSPFDLFTLSTLKDFLLPIILTLTYIPLLYFIFLCLEYQDYFLHLSYRFRNDASLAKKANRKVFWSCKLSLKKLRKHQSKIRSNFYRGKELEQALGI